MVTFREAEAEDADTLSQIALAAKAHWNYPGEWLDLWIDDLTVTADQIAAFHFIGAEDSQIATAFLAISIADSVAEVEHLWVRPRHMGRGIGRSLFRAAVQWCAAQGVDVLIVASDPNAVEFYEAMGCKVVGSQPSRPAPRALPVLRYETSAG